VNPPIILNAGTYIFLPNSHFNACKTILGAFFQDELIHIPPNFINNSQIVI